MAKGRKSGLENLVSVVAKLPWWVGLLLAVVAFGVLHPIASVPAEKPVGLEGLGGFAGKELLRFFALVGQYLLPGVFLVGAAASAIAQRRRRKLASEVGGAGARAIDSLDWREFEVLVGEAFRQQGFQVRETASGADGGVDLELRKGDELHLVQCKQWRAFKVGVSVVRELYGVMAARGASGGFVVTSGVYTKDATSFAAGRNIILIDGDQLRDMLVAGRAAIAKRAALDEKAPSVSQHPAEPAATQASSDAQVAVASPFCPVCGRAMVQRTARRGANAGKAFWGCTGFPGCRGTVPIP
jgi:restriction system protein